MLNVEFNVFIKNDIILIIYVNDLIFIKLDLAIIVWLRNVLHERFKMSDLKSCIYYLDMIIIKNRCLRLLILNQNVYVEQMLRDHEMWNCKSFVIFMNVSCRLIKILMSILLITKLSIFTWEAIFRKARMLYIFVVRPVLTYGVFA